MSIGELFIELGVIGHPEEVEKFNKKIKETAKSMDLTLKSTIKANGGLQDLEKGFKAFTTALKTSAIIGIIKTIDTLNQSLVSSNQAMLDLTRTSDIALGTFQKWGSIGKMLGVNNVEQQLEGLNQRMFDLMLTGEGARGFQLAGINPVGQDAEGVLEQLRNRVSGMSDTAASYLLQQMGLDQKMLHLLRMTRDDFEELGRTIDKYRLTDDQTKDIQAMNIQLQIAGIKLKYLKDRAILALMPAWTQFLASLARVTEGLETAVKWVTDFISKSPDLQSALKGVAVALGIIFAVAHPLLALFGALYLIIDDVMAYFNGGRSLTGAFMYRLDEYISELKDKFGDLSLDKVIPQVTLDVGEVIIKAGKVTLEKAQRTLDERFLTGKFVPPQLQGLEMMSLLLRGIFEKTKETVEQAKQQAEQVEGATGGAAPIDYTVKVEFPNWVQNMLTGAATGSKGYEGTLPNLSSHFISPAAERTMSSNTTNTDNRQINQTISIQSNQPVMDIQNQLTYARNAIAAGWA